jgi:hypothetical protein
VTRHSIGAAVTGAVFAALVPVAAFVILGPAEYGTFSLPYLIFALGLSVQFSVVTDAWTRTRAREQRISSRADFTAALIVLAAVFVVVAVVALLIFPETRRVWWSAGAIPLALIRNGLRYYAVANGMTRRALLGDLAGCAGFVAVLAIGLPRFDAFAVVIVAWAASAVTGAVGLMARLGWPRGVAPRWVREHRSSIRPLLADSLLMDLGGIGTPLVLAPLLGLGPFGVYRGISNVALPVRLVLDPLRPAIGTPRAAWIVRPLAVMGAIAFGALLAGGCYVVLAFAVPALGIELGTLSALEAFALPCAVYVFLSFVGHLYYIVCRSRLAPRQLILGRVLQTAAAIAFPLVGWAIGGLEGAVWAFVASTAVTAAIYLVSATTVRSPVPHAEPAPFHPEA